MDLRTYLTAAADKIDAAGKAGDRAEALRLLELVRDVVLIEIRKLEQAGQKRKPDGE